MTTMMIASTHTMNTDTVLQSKWKRKTVRCAHTKIIIIIINNIVSLWDDDKQEMQRSRHIHSGWFLKWWWWRCACMWHQPSQPSLSLFWREERSTCEFLLHTNTHHHHHSQKRHSKSTQSYEKNQVSIPPPPSSSSKTSHTHTSTKWTSHSCTCKHVCVSSMTNYKKGRGGHDISLHSFSENFPGNLILLAALVASLRDLAKTSGGGAEHGGASSAQHNGLGVWEHGGDLVASRALQVHEVRVGWLYQPLKLVLASLLSSGGVQQISGPVNGWD